VSQFVSRLVVTVVALPAVLWLVWLGGGWLLGLAVVAALIALHELYAMARSLRAGSTAHEAAGRVHTDIQERFVRAEVIGWRELVDAGGYAAARDRGLIRTEGRDYVVADGEVVHIKT